MVRLSRKMFTSIQAAEWVDADLLSSEFGLPGWRFCLHRSLDGRRLTPTYSRRQTAHRLARFCNRPGSALSGKSPIKVQ